jgi:hypothetical protein
MTSDVQCPTRYLLIFAPDNEHQRQVLLLPDEVIDEARLHYHYFTLYVGYQVFRVVQQGSVPYEHLPGPLRNLSHTYKFHPFTPTPRVKNQLYTLPVVFSVPSGCRPMPYPILHPRFELPSYTQRRELPVRICLEMDIQLAKVTVGVERLIWESMKYKVVGSLGLNGKPSEEILLLKACQTEFNHPYRYVQLVVHPTHVSGDIGLLLSYEGEWLNQVERKARKWQREDASMDFEEQLRREMLVYAQYLRNLREQIHV